MRAYLFTYKHTGDESKTTYCCWKIAKDEKTAFKLAFGKSQRKNEKTFTTKSKMRIELLTTEDYDVSKIFPISPIPKREPAKELSNTGEWML
tara:strand:+ start:4345 stop:4620 length:276 start_codon:yes stop_codon:yes gene_type:complete